MNSHDAYAAIFRTIPQACAVLSADLRVVDANAEFCALTSLSLDAVRRQPVLTVMSAGAVALDDRSLDRLRESMLKALAALARDTVELPSSVPGRSTWLFTSNPVAGADGKASNLALMVEGGSDTSRLEETTRGMRDRWLEAEERFRSLANRLPGIVYRRIMTSGGGIRDIYVSDGVEAYLGVSARELMSGACRLLDFVHPDDRARKLQAMEEAALKKRSLTIEVRKLARPDNQIRWWRVHTTPTVLSEGVTQWDGFAIDITEQKVAEQQLHHAMKLEAVGQLTGGIAHDFNNHLTIILGNAEALVRNLHNQPLLRPLAVLTQNAAERAADLTNRLLLFARRQTLEPRTVDVNNLVRAMELLLQRALGEQVELCFSHGAGLWKAFIDPGQFESALLNLALNAKDAMTEGGRLIVETANVEIGADYAKANDIPSPGRYVMLAVSDNGCGMSPDTVARAFEPFFTTKPFGKGSGLGLSMVYGFMKQSGGHVSLYSEVGHGTTVKLFLPQSLAEAGPLVVHDGSSEIPSGSETILLVEDDEMVRPHIKGMLEGLGYTVLTARNGPDALREIDDANGVGLLLTDVVMPGGMTGKALADEALRRHPGMRVLFMSGYTESAMVHHGRLDHGVHLLRKPFRLRELAEKLRVVLDQPATTEDKWYIE